MAEVSPLDIGTLISTIVSHLLPSLEHLQHFLPMVWTTIMQMLNGQPVNWFNVVTQATKDTHPSVGQDFDTAAFDPTEMSFMDVISSDWFNIVIVGIGSGAMYATIAVIWYLWVGILKPMIEKKQW